MSVKQLIATKGIASSIVGRENDGTAVVPIAPAYSWAQQYAATPPQVNLATGSFTTWQWIPSANDFSQIRDIELQGTAITADGTNLLTVYNPFFLLSQVKLYVNGSVLCWHQDQFQIEGAVDSYLKDFSDPEIYVEVQKMINNVNPLSGDQITTAGIPVRWSMFTLFPTLKNILLNLSGLQRIQFDITFTSNTNSLTNTMVGVSSTTANAYNSSISYNGLQFNVLYYQNSDSRTLSVPQPLMLRFKNFYTFQVPNVSWTNVGTDGYLLQLNTAFPQCNKWVQGVLCWIYDNTNSGGSYNASTASQRFSGASYMSYVVRSRGNILYDVSQPVAQLNQRRRYEYDVWKSRNLEGDNMPIKVATNGDTLNKYFVKPTFIDLSCIMQNEGDTERVLSGRDTLSNDITIQFYCGSSLSANCTLYFELMYETAYIMKQTGAINQI